MMRKNEKKRDNKRKLKKILKMTPYSIRNKVA